MGIRYKQTEPGVAGLGPGHELLPGWPIQQATAQTRSPAWNCSAAMILQA